MSTAGMVDKDHVRLSDEELQNLQEARNCPNCTVMGTEQAGMYPVDAGLKISLNHKNSYLELYTQYQRSGGYRRLLDEDGEQYHYGYRMVFDWERRNVIKTGVEAGYKFELLQIPMTLYGRAQNTTFMSRARIAEQGDTDFYESRTDLKRPNMNQMNFEAGLRINLFDKKKKKK